MSAAAPTRRGLIAAGIALKAVLAPATAAAIATPHPDARLIQLCGEFTRLEHEIHRIHKAQPAGITMEQEAEPDRLLIDPIEAQQDALLELIEAIPATTTAGVIARMKMLIAYCPEKAEYDPDDYQDARLLALLLRDGAALWAGHV